MNPNKLVSLLFILAVIAGGIFLLVNYLPMLISFATNTFSLAIILAIIALLFYLLIKAIKQLIK